MFTTTSKSPLGTLNDRNHRGVFNALAGAALACMAIASSHVHAAAVVTFFEVEGDIIAVVSGTLNVDGAESDTRAWPSTEFTGETGSDLGLLLLNPDEDVQAVGSVGEPSDVAVYYSLSVPTENTWATKIGGKGGVHSGIEFWLNTVYDPFIGFNQNNPPVNNVYTLDATLYFGGLNFFDIGAAEGKPFVYTLLDSDSNPLTGADQTLTVCFGECQLAPVPLPASVLFLGAGIGGFGLMGRLRRRKLNA